MTLASAGTAKARTSSTFSGARGLGAGWERDRTREMSGPLSSPAEVCCGTAAGVPAAAVATEGSALSPVAAAIPPAADATTSLPPVAAPPGDGGAASVGPAEELAVTPGVAVVAPAAVLAVTGLAFCEAVAPELPLWPETATGELSAYEVAGPVLPVFVADELALEGPELPETAIGLYSTLEPPPEPPPAPPDPTLVPPMLEASETTATPAAPPGAAPDGPPSAKAGAATAKGMAIAAARDMRRDPRMCATF